MIHSRPKLALPSRRSKLAAGFAVLLLLALLAGYFQPGRIASAGGADVRDDHTADDKKWPWQDQANSAEQAHTPRASLTQVRTKVLEHGVLKGTQVAGSWSVGSDGQPHPSMALRERFEYYLLGLGDASPTDIRALIAEEAEAALGVKSAQAVLAVFDRYWALRMHQPRYRMVVEDRSTWSAAFEEQKALRRQYLGADWAQAFFHDEEALFAQTMSEADSAQASSAKPAPTPTHDGNPIPEEAPGANPAEVHAKRQALYGEAAAQRMAQLDAQWASWERRLDQAKALQRTLAAASDLSDVQRKQRFEAHLRSNFDPSEYGRALGLLGWP